MRLRGAGALAAGFFAGCFVVVIGLAMFAAVNQQQSQCSAELTTSVPPSAGAAAIPPDLAPLFRQAATHYGLGPSGWAWLASINGQETDFGRNLSVSSAGAIGWMQFMPSTWALYGVDAHGSGRKDPNDPADAIFAAANYLHALRAPADWHHAVFVYGGGAEWYFAQVAQRARGYMADPGSIAIATATGVPSVRASWLAVAAGSDAVGLTLTGYTSTFADRGTASGIPADGSWPGIAVLDAATLGGYWKVTYPQRPHAGAATDRCWPCVRPRTRAGASGRRHRLCRSDCRRLHGCQLPDRPRHGVGRLPRQRPPVRRAQRPDRRRRPAGRLQRRRLHAELDNWRDRYGRR
jgi:hypothetical protein